MDQTDPRTIARWREATRPFARPAPLPEPGRTALLVVDVQRYFEEMCAPIVSAIRRAVEACHALGVPVFFTRHGHADPQVDGGMLARWWGDLILEGTDGHRLLEGIGFRPDLDTIVPKRRYSAFYETPLEGDLRGRGIEDLAIAGVMTNLCVETTARAAFIRDFRVRVLIDATATATEAMHLASLLNLAYGFAHLQTTEEWVSGLGERGG